MEIVEPALYLLRVLAYFLWFCLESMFYQVFYYIGVIPVWILTLGKYPTAAPHNLSKENRRIYGLIGVLFTVLLALLYFYLT